VYINVSGSPALAKAGSGDILTGMIAGLAAQFPGQLELAVRAAVWMHGRCGELAAQEWTDKCVLATDLLGMLPRAIREIA
jgi:NAD(P)H-hydrate epimerase